MSLAALRDRLRRFPYLSAAAAPVVAGGLSLALTWWVWGHWSPLPIAHDEAAYMLQARIFAAGRWSSPPPPMPEAFEQYHVLVRPVLAAKYHPGQALALMPGVWLGRPVLGPLLITGLTGALVFALARSLAGTAAAALATLLWLVAPMSLKFRPSYLSEVTTALWWVASFYPLNRWAREGGRGWLAATALSVSACLLTRPLTGLVLFIVVAAVVLVRIRRTGRWRDLILPAILGLSVPAGLGLWSWETIGDLRESPRTLYTRQYMPWDRLGFGLDSTPPTMPLSADFRRYVAQFDTLHAAYTPASMPAVLARRLWALGLYAFGAGVIILGICLGVGAIRLPREALVGLGSMALLLIAHLSYAHPDDWTVYYLEGLPVLAFFAAAGAVELCRWPRANSAPLGGRAGRAVAVASRVLVGLSVGAGVALIPFWRRWHRQDEASIRAFREALAAVDGGRAVVFVRYDATHRPARSLITNTPDPTLAPVWVVLDLGAEKDRALLAEAGTREPWLFEECSGRLFPWNPGAGTAADRAGDSQCSGARP